VIVLQCHRCLCPVTSMPRNSGHLASGGWSCWDAEPHGTNPGHPGKSGTGGNPTLYTPRNVLTANEISVPKIAMNDTIRFFKTAIRAFCYDFCAWIWCHQECLVCFWKLCCLVISLHVVDLYICLCVSLLPVFWRIKPFISNYDSFRVLFDKIASVSLWRLDRLASWVYYYITKSEAEEF